jgi:hypothetical protein
VAGAVRDLRRHCRQLPIDPPPLHPERTLPIQQLRITEAGEIHPPIVEVRKSVRK